MRLQQLAKYFFCFLLVGVGATGLPASSADSAPGPLVTDAGVCPSWGCGTPPSSSLPVTVITPTYPGVCPSWGCGTPPSSSTPVKISSPALTAADFGVCPSWGCGTPPWSGLPLTAISPTYAESAVLGSTGSLTATPSASITNNQTLSNQSNYSGKVVVSSGTTTISGSTPDALTGLIVGTEATLMGAGTISGEVMIMGTLKPGNSPGYLSVQGGTVMSSGSMYMQDIAGTIQASANSPIGAQGYYSYLNVAGQFTISNGVTLEPRLQNLFLPTESGYGSAPYVPVLGDMFRMVTAAGGISGTFAALTQPVGLAAGTQFIAFYNYGGSNSIDLATIPTSYRSTLSGSNSNAQSVAGVLDKLSVAQLSGSATALQTNLMYAAASQRAASLGGFSLGLAGEVYGAALAAIPQTTQRMQNTVLSRLSDTVMPVSLGSAMTRLPTIASQVTAQNPMGVPSSSVSSNPGVNPQLESLSTTNKNVWGDISYQYGSRSADSNASGSNSHLYQAVFGADFYQERGAKAGAGLSLSTTSVSLSRGSGTVGQAALFAYGKLPLMQHYVIDGLASVGLSTTDVSRSDVTAASSLKGKSINGSDSLLSVGISRPFEADEFIVTPYLRATWQMVNQSSFDEGTTSAAALSVNGYTGNGARGLLGVAVGSKNKDPLADAYTYKVNVALGADTNTLINPSLSANLAGYGTVIQNASVGNVFVQAGLYGTIKFAENTYAYAGLTAEARSGQTLAGANLGLKIQF